MPYLYEKIFVKGRDKIPLAYKWIIYLDYEESFLVLQIVILYNRFFIKYTVKVWEATDNSLRSKW